MDARPAGTIAAAAAAGLIRRINAGISGAGVAPVRLCGIRFGAHLLPSPSSHSEDVPGMNPITGLLSALGVLTVVYVGGWANAVRSARQAPGGDPAARDFGAPNGFQILLGLFTNFFDALGIGSFATTTAVFRLRRGLQRFGGGRPARRKLMNPRSPVLSFPRRLPTHTGPDRAPLAVPRNCDVGLDVQSGGPVLADSLGRTLPWKHATARRTARSPGGLWNLGRRARRAGHPPQEW